MLSFPPSAKMDSKRNKRNRIYNYVYARKLISRPELAGALHISLPTVSQYVAELQADGLVVESGILDSTGGRKPVGVACDPVSHTSVGLSITVKDVSAVMLDLYGNVLAADTRYVPFEDTPAYADMLGEVVDSLTRAAQIAKERVLGVTVAVPGLVSTDCSHITYSHVFPTGLSVSSLCRRIPYPFLMCNDASAAGYAELWDLPFEDTAAYLSLSDTVGGAIIMNSALYAGRNNRSGEFGHVVIDRDGPRCRCGQRGCLGCYVSANLLSGDYNNRLDQFFAALERGDRHAADLWDDYLHYLAAGIGMLHTMLDCEVIIGGHIGSYIEPHIERLHALVAARNPFDHDGSFVRPCRRKEMASATGAALQPIVRFLESV